MKNKKISKSQLEKFIQRADANPYSVSSKKCHDCKCIKYIKPSK